MTYFDKVKKAQPTVAKVQTRQPEKLSPTAAMHHVVEDTGLMSLQRIAKALPNQIQTAEAPVQRTTVVFPTTGMDDYADMLDEAREYHDAHGTGLLYDSVGDHITGEAGDDTRFDVFAHGNEGQVGDYTNPNALKDELNRLATRFGMPGFNTVTLHSCESGTPHPHSGARYGDTLHESFRDEFKYVDVHSFTGETVIDREGHTRVLKEGKTMGEYLIAKRSATDRAELEDEFFQPVGSGTHTSGDQTLDMYSAARDDLYDPTEIREDRMKVTQENMDYIAEQSDDTADGHERHQSVLDGHSTI